MQVHNITITVIFNIYTFYVVHRTKALVAGASVGVGYAIWTQLRKPDKSRAVGTENTEEDFVLPERPPEFKVGYIGFGISKVPWLLRATCLVRDYF